MSYFKFNSSNVVAITVIIETYEISTGLNSPKLEKSFAEDRKPIKRLVSVAITSKQFAIQQKFQQTIFDGLSKYISIFVLVNTGSGNQP